MSRITIEQLAELLAQDKAGTVNRELLQAFLRSPSSVLHGITSTPTAPTGTQTEGGFTLKVNYGLTVALMVAFGDYNWSNDDITQDHFPHDSTLGEVEVTAELVHFGKYMGTDAVLAELDRRGLRPATMAELLAFGAAFPEEQRKYPIVELGSIWTRRDGNRFVGCLSRHGSERRLRLSGVEGDWNDSYRFLAVRK